MALPLPTIPGISNISEMSSDWVRQVNESAMLDSSKTAICTSKVISSTAAPWGNRPPARPLSPKRRPRATAPAASRECASTFLQRNLGLPTALVAGCAAALLGRMCPTEMPFSSQTVEAMTEAQVPNSSSILDASKNEEMPWTAQTVDALTEEQVTPSLAKSQQPPKTSSASRAAEGEPWTYKLEWFKGSMLADEEPERPWTYKLEWFVH
eukprot:gb/GFBE01074950.1/.p1 GENE.gb/GFBE01074950.1/~~gb/GFBE01074950.1/.p1  ORF type:complete len:210 (+),score=36.49 gb/GFBE01074950.1/:1-630(+)